MGLVAEDLPPDVRVQAIGADYEIEGAGVSVAERDLDAVIGLSDRGDAGSGDQDVHRRLAPSLGVGERRRSTSPDGRNPRTLLGLGHP